MPNSLRDDDIARVFADNVGNQEVDKDPGTTASREGSPSLLASFMAGLAGSCIIALIQQSARPRTVIIPVEVVSP